MQPRNTLGAESKVEQLASAAGWILVALALVVLYGWAFHIPALISVVPGLATFKANTAATFLLVGLALLRRRLRDSRAVAVAVLVIGGATLIQYLAKLDLGIDQLLFRDPYSDVDPGRMSQATCVGFVLLGTALACMNAKASGWRKLSRGLGLTATALGTIAFLGYSYDVHALYQVQPYSTMAVHSGLAFVIAGLALQCVNPAEGIVLHIRSDSTGGAMLRQLLPAALAIPYLLGLAVWLAHRRFGLETGFSLALMVAATILCLVLIMLLNATRLEREDLARREINRSLEERTALLQAREELLNNFVTHVPVAVAMLDREMRYLQVSNRWCSEYTLDNSQILGRSHFEVFPDIPEHWKHLLRRCLTGETIQAQEERWDRADGSSIWLRWEIRPWGSRDGPPEGVLIFSQDITDRKQVESTLRDNEQQLRVLAGSLLTAQEDERRRLSRELHDDVTQRLALLSIDLGKLAGEVPASLAHARATIRALQEHTLQASVEVRRLSHGLHPSVIEDFGLSIALEEYCAEFAKAQGIQVRFEDLVDDSRLDDACASCLYRITQESMRNAVTHGDATEVGVTLSVGSDSMQLRVSDNGTGFLSESPRSRAGLGMISMKERVRLVNGTLTISSQPGQGTEITASVPLLRNGNG